MIIFPAACPFFHLSFYLILVSKGNDEGDDVCFFNLYIHGHMKRIKKKKEERFF